VCSSPDSDLGSYPELMSQHLSRCPTVRSRAVPSVLGASASVWHRSPLLLPMQLGTQDEVAHRPHPDPETSRQAGVCSDAIPRHSCGPAPGPGALLAAMNATQSAPTRTSAFVRSG
jgi:hypothetical protein